ncbi:aminopeptidase [Clostridium thermarum]|uniref:aminopeptidase n=1 Tax=Clostridium thermarum TaxID=1716543 RepID=UPI001123037C|nr:aminopeptidase [Clostridium thermarum]
MNQELLNKYASLVVKIGANVQPGQTVVLMSPVETADFARAITEAAYTAGARDVFVEWNDEKLSRIKYLNAPDEVFDEVPSWKKDFTLTNLRKGAAFIQIKASDPDAFKGVDVSRISRSMKAFTTELKEYHEALMSNKNAWCIASVPTEAWARKVFPELPAEEAVARLWEAILKAVRVDTEDPVAAWKEHTLNLKKSMAFMNDNNFKYLHYRNSLGTDLTIELPEGHVWVGGSEETTGGVKFIANMPTEEVFTLPKKTGVNGTVVSSMPLNHNGSLVDKFSITFKDGRITDYTAEVGYEVLKSIIETDEGSHYLGEVALVPKDSPISNQNILFYNTLFDENASCHLAIGRAYSPCIKNNENMSEKQLEEAGVNNSLIHVDFMIGTKDLEITGITADGKEIPVFIDGNFAF